MARTIRTGRKGKGKTRDGADIRQSRSCRNHGSCPRCRGDRLHKHERRAPVLSGPDLFACVRLGY